MSVQYMLFGSGAMGGQGIEDATCIEAGCRNLWDARTAARNHGFEVAIYRFTDNAKPSTKPEWVEDFRP